MKQFDLKWGAPELFLNPTASAGELAGAAEKFPAGNPSMLKPMAVGDSVREYAKNGLVLNWLVASSRTIIPKLFVLPAVNVHCVPRSNIAVRFAPTFNCVHGYDVPVPAGTASSDW